MDEAVRLKDAATLMAQSVLRLSPPYRMVLTATPVKNKLRDLFWLAWWAAGGRPEPHALFPFPGTEQGQRDFLAQYLITERNLTKEDDHRARTGHSRKFKRDSTQPTNLQGLYKILSPILIRRRKEDMPDLPPKHHHLIRVPMGTAQALLYRHVLHRPAVGLAEMGAKLQALRTIAANPASPLVGPRMGLTAAMAPNYTPKLAAALGLIAKRLAAQQPGILFSAFNSSLDTLSRYLTEAGIPHLVLDGRTPPDERGRLAATFKQGGIPLLLAGVESMAELHSFSHCRWCALMAYSWQPDKFLQAINRIHRFDSPGPVDVYSILCAGSIDLRLNELITEKLNAASLVIDGQLTAAAAGDVNLAELHQSALAAWKDDSPTLDEEDIRRYWPDLRRELSQAWATWPQPDREITLSVAAATSAAVARFDPDETPVAPVLVAAATAQPSCPTVLNPWN